MLTIDNGEHTAPAAFNDDLLEVSRKIEREEGSPTGSTARKSAPATCSSCSPVPPPAARRLWSCQGQISEIISAKPQAAAASGRCRRHRRPPCRRHGQAAPQGGRGQPGSRRGRDPRLSARSKPEATGPPGLPLQEPVRRNPPPRSSNVRDRFSEARDEPPRLSVKWRTTSRPWPTPRADSDGNGPRR